MANGVKEEQQFSVEVDQGKEELKEIVKGIMHVIKLKGNR